MEIGKPYFSNKNNKIFHQVDVKSSKGQDTLWFSLDESHSDLLSDRSDAFLTALIIPAMQANEDIHIKGSVSEKLIYNFSRRLQNILQQVIPTLNTVKIYPEEIIATDHSPPIGVATGFSAGIDSFCVLADHHYFNPVEGFKISHLLFNNVGSHGKGGESLFSERYQRLLPTANILGLPFISIDSNLDSFYNQHLNFQQTHTLRNASVAQLLQKGIGRFLYASTYNYADTFVGSTYDMAYCDPITLPLLSTGLVECFSVGSEYTRVDKTLRVAEIADSYNTLDVCVNAFNQSQYTNCGACWKCQRTLATFDIAGLLDNYTNSFDLETYYNQRSVYFAMMLKSKDPLIQEIVQFAKSRNYSFPLSSHIIHAFRAQKLAKLSSRAITKLKRIINQ